MTSHDRLWERCVQWEVGGGRVGGSTARYGGAERGSPMTKSYKIRYLFSINGIYDRRQGVICAKARRKRDQNCFQSFLYLKNAHRFHICSQRVLRLSPSVVLEEREIRDAGAGRSRKMRPGSEALPQCCIHYSRI